MNGPLTSPISVKANYNITCQTETKIKIFMVGPTFLYDLEVGLEGQKVGNHWSKALSQIQVERLP